MGFGKIPSSNRHGCKKSILKFSKYSLIFSYKVSTLSADAKAILLNPEIIAINQDPVIGEPLKPFFWGKNPDGTWDP